MDRVVVSQCLLGVKCRYDGRCAEYADVRREACERGWIPVCPEILGGLTTPRAPSERRGDRVVSREGEDVTEAFRRGAEEALRIARLYGAEYALLKERSPSCGCGEIYDGTFSGCKTSGDGVTAALFLQNGVRVYGESALQALLARLDGVSAAQADELDQVCRFYGEICAAQDPSTGAPGWDMEYYPDREELRTHIERGELYLNRRDGRIAAAMVLKKAEEASELHLFAVHPDFRGKRISDEMLARAFSLARRNGAASLKLDVVRGNAPAVRLYERTGFQKTGGYTAHFERSGDIDFDQYEYNLTEEG